MANTIIQWNCNGIISKLSEIQIIKNENSPFVLALQETHLKPNESFRLRGYQCFRKDVNPTHRARGGVAIFVRNNIPTKDVRLVTDLQATAVQIEVPLRTTICNIYLPDGNWHSDHIQNIIDQLPRPFLILGDFNSHSPRWGDSKHDNRGKKVESLIETNNLCILNSGNPTHFEARSGKTSVIDLSLCSPSGD
ncbi:hypothetical protein JTB14_030859 [Gonioctena quinquepunctata]|nr:hypothetical protein JTB14_030859 [Gonioctena quinquepunctata]